MQKQIQLDIHTHTIMSGHGFATLTEMANAAASKGLPILGITEHAEGIPGTCDDLYFVNLRVVPREMFGVHLYLGAEINILDYTGALSLDDRHMDYCDICIAGIHKYCYSNGSIRKHGCRYRRY